MKRTINKTSLHRLWSPPKREKIDEGDETVVLELVEETKRLKVSEDQCDEEEDDVDTKYVGWKDENENEYEEKDEDTRSDTFDDLE